MGLTIQTFFVTLFGLEGGGGRNLFWWGQIPKNYQTVYTRVACDTCPVILLLRVKNNKNISLKYRISWLIRRTFFLAKCDLNSTCVLCAKGKYYFQTINTRASIIQYLYREIVKFASKSWDLASLLVNGLLSYPGIYPNVYIASCVIPGIYAAAVAKCVQV